MTRMTMAGVEGAGLGILSRRHVPTVALGFASGISFVLYFFTISADFTWRFHGADGAELMAAAVTLGIPHPPGYPLYVLLGHVVGQLGLGSVPYRFHLLSALCMALSGGVIAHLAAGLASRRQNQVAAGSPGSRRKDVSRGALYLGLTAGIGFALLPLVWQQASISEVYATNMLFVSLALWHVLRQDVTHAALRAGLFLGLAVTSHLTSLLLLPLAFYAIHRQRWARLVAGLAMGLTPFLALPWLGAGNSPIMWGEPNTLRGWWWLVSAEIYRPNVFGLTFSSWGERLRTWSSEPTIWIFAVLFVYSIWRLRLIRRTRSNGKASRGLVVTAAFYVLYAYTYDAPDALVFTLPALAIVTLLAASSVRSPSALHLLLPIALLTINFQQMTTSDPMSPRVVAESSLLSAPQNAIMLTSGDRATFSLWYLQQVETKREDVIVVDRDLMAFAWYRLRLKQAYPSLSGLDVDDIVNFRELNRSTHPWCELEIDVNNRKQTYCLGETT